MTQSAFYKLVGILKASLESTNRSRGRDPNGTIGADLKLSMAIRFFAGGDPLDIMLSHGVSYTSVYKAIWEVVDAVNQSPYLAISFPKDHQSQQQIADGFKQKSKANFGCCIGAIDGTLIWTTKPTLSDCDAMNVGEIKFMCGRKKRYGLLLQAICDHHRRFTDIYIGHPGATADYLAFMMSPIKKQLEKVGFLAPGLCLFGDNAYINNGYMVTPYKGVLVGSDEDSFNFYQSQVRINIECAFGIFTQRWGILRKPINASMGVAKIVALVSALCKLHNYCINENQGLEPLIPRDEGDIYVESGLSSPLELATTENIC